MMALPETHKEALALLKPTQFHHRAVAIIFSQTPTRNPLFVLWAAQEAFDPPALKRGISIEFDGY
jgi:hypothetical protein